MRTRAKTKQRDIAKSVKDNPKVFWKYVNSKTKSNKAIGDSHIVDGLQNKTVVTTDQVKADVFSEYFASVFTNEPLHNIPDPMHPMPENSMPNIQISAEIIGKELDKLNVNKSCGPDNLHPRILRVITGYL